MGFLSGLMGVASEADADKVEEQLKDFLLPDENIIKAYQLVRDLTILTDRRIILIDKQGLTGRRTEYVCIPYRSIVKYSIETTGHFDLDADVKLWLSSHPEPIELEFRKSRDVAELVRVISQYTC
jgi:hypothetical protein